MVEINLCDLHLYAGFRKTFLHYSGGCMKYVGLALRIITSIGTAN